MFLVITSTAKLEHTYGQNQKQVLKISEQKIKEEEQRNFFKIPSSLLLQYNTKSKNRVPKIIIIIIIKEKGILHVE